MSTLSQFSGGGVKNVQRGTISIIGLVTSNTATINSVNTSKTMINYLGNTTNVASNLYNPYLTLTNSTTVTAQRNSATSGAVTTVSYEVIEFY